MSDERAPLNTFFERVRPRTRTRPVSDGNAVREYGASELVEVINALPHGVLVCSDDARIEFVNEAMATGWRDAGMTLVGEQISILAGPYAGDLEGLRIRESVRKQEGPFRATVFNAAGMARSCEIRVTPLSGGRSLVLVRDRGDEERIEADLRLKSEVAMRGRALLEATAEALGDGLIVLDDIERVVLVNGIAEQIFGVPRSISQGLSLGELDLPNPIRGAWFSLLGTQQSTCSATLRLDAPKGARTILFRISRVATADRMPMGSLLVARDLTALAGPEQLRQDMLVSLAHELRTPLQSVQGFAETLVADPDLDAETAGGFHEVMLQESKRLRSAVERLLALMGAHPLTHGIDKAHRDVRPVVRAAAEKVERTHELRDDYLAIDMPEEDLVAWIDAESIEAVVREVVRNAVVHGTSERGVRMRLRRRGARILVEVRDWGCGVDPGELVKIFDPFFRAHASKNQDHGGDELGLGLPFCRQALLAHEGAIEAELPLGGGLRVTISLPAVTRT